MESACQGRPVLSVAFSRSASALIVPVSIMVYGGPDSFHPLSCMRFITVERWGRSLPQVPLHHLRTRRRDDDAGIANRPRLLDIVNNFCA